jgi:hypothetical protein
MAKKPDLDDATLRIARALLSAPPKQHGDMKIGKRKASRGKSPKRKVAVKPRVNRP